MNNINNITNKVTNSFEKKYVLDIIYKHINLNLIKYNIIQNINSLSQIKESSYIVTPHYHGYNYFFLMINYNFENKIYIVSKKDLKYNNYYNDNININTIDYINNIDTKYFNFTILEGKIIYNKNSCIFIFNDIFYLSGKNLLSDKIDNKLPLINILINSLSINNILLKIINIYKINMLNELIFNKIKKSNYKINGLIFYPIITGISYIYVNDQEFEKLKTNNDNITDITNIVYENQNTNENQNLIIQKTKQIDVYNVMNLNNNKRYGILYVPNIDNSHKLRKIFSDIDQKIFYCGYNQKFNKWYVINF